MQQPLRPFLISEFKSGINTYLQPWKRPVDAFDPLLNAYIYRGTVNKRSGFKQYGNTLADGNPVMGIMRWVNETTGDVSLLVATTVNLYLYDPGTNTYSLVGTPPTFTGTIKNFFNWTNWQPFTGGSSLLWMVNNKDRVTTFDGTNANQPTITIDGAGTTITTALDVVVYKQRLLLIRPTLSTGGTQNQAIYWSAIQNPTLWRTDIAGQGGFLDAPTGDIIQSAEFIRDVLVVFFTNSTWIFRFTGNNTDPFRWDKVNNTKSTNAPYGSVAYDERSTSIGNTGLIACDGVNVQRYDVPIIDYYETNFSEQFYSQAFSQRYENLNQSWTMYVSQSNNFPKVGNIAPGSDRALIYNFLENTWATYTWTRPMTALGLFYNQAGETWADLNQAWETVDAPWYSYSNQNTAPILLAGDTTGHVWWMDNSNTVVDEQLNNSDEIIAVGSGVANYTGTLAHFPVVSASLTITDGTETFVGDVYGGLIGNLGGTGTIVYSTGDFNITFHSVVPALTNITADYVSGISIVPDIVTTRWNPLIEMGQKVQFCYIDIYYLKVSVEPLNPISVTLNFYVDNTDLTGAPTLSRPLTLDGSTQSDSAFKRIYINIIGEFIRMEIDPDVDSFMQFIGFILWVSPAGRLTGP
jgi:hypothetical protein